MNENLGKVMKIPKKARWERESDETGQEFAAFLENFEYSSTEDSVIAFVKDWYLRKSTKKPIAATNLNRKLSLLLFHLQNSKQEIITSRGIKKVKYVIGKWERSILDLHPKSQNKTKYLPIKRLKQLGLRLWKSDLKLMSGAKNRCASMVLLTCWLSGARTIDALRLRWEDLKIVNNSSGKFVVAKIRHSKGNVGKRPEQLTFLQLDDPEMDIIKRLHRWWKFQGKPVTGHIFCDKITKVPYQRAQIVRSMRQMAKKLKWPEENWPRAHTGRKSVVLLLLKLGVTPQSLRIFLRWGPESQMPAYYQGTGLETTDMGTSFQLGGMLNSGKILEIEKDL